jgi:arginine decarboxylase
MNIKVVRGKGEGKTKLSAFDAALKNAGVYNYNLIYLSSVIPPNSEIVKVENFESPKEEYGNRLYVVCAEDRSDEVGKFIGAGLGWYQFEGNKGVFVEHHIKGETQVAVKSELNQRIINSIKDLCEFRGIIFQETDLHSEINIAEVKNNPTSVLVIAVYKSEGWD